MRAPAPAPSGANRRRSGPAHLARLRASTFAAAPLAACAFLALAALFAAPAQAQSVTTFVSNLNQPGGRGVVVSNEIGDEVVQQIAQEFTTGPGAFGLRSVVVRSRDPQGDSFSVSVCEIDSHSKPTAPCTALTAPSAFAAGSLSFTAPPGTTLAANTRYAVVCRATGSGAVSFETTPSDDEDSGASTGWSIKNYYLAYGTYYDPDSSHYDVPFWLSGDGVRSLRIAIKGSAATDATLSALTLTNSYGDDVPIISTTTTSYSANMVFADKNVTIEGTPTDTNASVEYLDSNGAVLVDSIPVKDGLQYTFPVGTHSFTIKVTAEDGTATRTYTLSATRAQGTVCAKPDIAPGRTEVWSGTLKPGQIWLVQGGSNRFAGEGYNSSTDYIGSGTLSDTSFSLDLDPTSLGSRADHYAITGFLVDNNGDLYFGIEGRDGDIAIGTDAAVPVSNLEPLRLHYCDQTREFDDALEKAHGFQWNVSDFGVVNLYRVASMVAVISGPPGTDTTPPRIDASLVTQSGDRLHIYFNERMANRPGTLPPASAFTVKADGIEVEVVSVAGTRNERELYLILPDRAISQNHLPNGSLDEDREVLVTVSYEIPDTFPILTDSSGEAAEAFTDVPVTNNSTVARAAVPATQTETRQDPPPLTARFGDLPAEHDGRKFKVHIVFSEALTDTKGVMMRAAVDVSGGRAMGSRRVDGSWAHRTVTVKPDGFGPVTVSLVPKTDCAAAGAICTDAGEPLTNLISARIQGPVALSVADATVREAPGAALEFEVTLNRAASGTVFVDYGTFNATARAGADYTSARGRLRFAPGETEKTVRVNVIDDSHDEGEETMTLRLFNANGAVIEDGEATGTIENSDPMPKAWLARFGRTVGSQVMEAVSQRLDGSPANSHLTVGGVSLGGSTPLEAESLTPQDWLAAQMADGPDTRASEERLLSARDLLLGTSFHLVSETEPGGGAALSAWGRVSTGGFRVEVDDVSMDGDVTSGFLGFDAEWNRLLAGLLLGRSEGDGTYGLSGDRGTITSTLTGVYPYARLRLSNRLTAWGMAGVGSGDLTLTQPHEVIATALGLRLGAIGITGTLLEGAALDLAVKSDALWVRTESDAAVGLASASAQVSRLRLILEAGRTFTLSARTLTPTVQVGLRHDGGDAETGTGVEVGAGIRYTAGMLSLEGQVRALLAHESGGYEEWGASGSIRLSPNASGLGASLAVRPSWGASQSGVTRLWSQPQVSSSLSSGSALGSSSPGRLDAELGYGLSALRGRGVLTPYTRVSLVEGDGHSWHLGTRLALAESLSLSLEGSRRRRSGHETVHDLALRASLPW